MEKIVWLSGPTLSDSLTLEDEEVLENVFILYKFFQVDRNCLWDGIALFNLNYVPGLGIEFHDVVEVCEQGVGEHEVLTIPSHHDHWVYILPFYTFILQNMNEFFGAQIFHFIKLYVDLGPDEGVQPARCGFSRNYEL